MLRFLLLVAAVLGVVGCISQDKPVGKKKSEAEYRELETALKADLQKSRTPQLVESKFSDLPAIAKPQE